MSASQQRRGADRAAVLLTTAALAGAAAAQPAGAVVPADGVDHSVRADEAARNDAARANAWVRTGTARTDDTLRAIGQRGRHGAPIALRTPSRANGAYVAKVLRATVVRERPGAGGRFWTARTATAHSHGATRLLVLAARRDGRGRAWLKVDAPIRPNGRAGWVAARDVRLSRTSWYLSVSTGRRELRVYRDGRLRRRARLVVGAPATPTPHGLFAVYEITRQADPAAFVGPYALHLTALSNVLWDFGGGPGRVALHGRGPASLIDPLGSARSHGCLRADNAVIDWLRGRARPGTPIWIGP